MKFPQAFLDRIAQILPAEEVDAYLDRCTAPLPKVIRKTPNLHTVPDHWHLKPTAVPEAFLIERDDQSEIPLGKTLEHFSGQIYVQSLSSMLPVQILNPQPESLIFDFCAAPGSKTTFLAEKMKHTGCIIANEPSSTRSKKLASNLDRLGAHNTVMIQSDGTILNNFFDQEFDQILLDAPCSSEGFGRKDASFFTDMWSEAKILDAAKLQKRLIVSAFEILAPGGTMLYSTCTSAPEENEGILQHLFDQYPDSVELKPLNMGTIPHKKGLTHWDDEKFDPQITENTARLYPHLSDDLWDSESFFVSLIHKTADTPKVRTQKPLKTMPPNVFNKNKQAELRTQFTKRYGLNKSVLEGGLFFERNQEIHFATKKAVQFGMKNLYRRIGLTVADKDENLTHAWALWLGRHATTNIMHLTTPQKDQWLQGYDLETDEIFAHKNILIQYKSFPLGWGKYMKGKIKNKLDRHLVF